MDGMVTDVLNRLTVTSKPYGHTESVTVCIRVNGSHIQAEETYGRDWMVTDVRNRLTVTSKPYGHRLTVVFYISLISS